MMNKEKKIIPYPNLNKKLLEKGTDLLQEGKFKEALACFNQLIELDDHTSSEAHIGIVICYMELGQLEKSKEKCRSLLFSDIGDYYEVLNIYVTILFQLNDYDEILEVVEAALSENNIPPVEKENLENLKMFANKMKNDFVTINHENDTQFQERTLISNLQDSEAGPEKQWAAIQQLNLRDDDVVIEAFKEFVENGDNDPVLISFVLQMLHAKGIEETVKVNKLNRSLEVNLKDLQDVFQMQFPHDVITELKQMIEQKNPTLFEQTTQLWWHYLLVIYPFIPNGKNAKTWAAALHAAANKMNGISNEINQIASAYQVDNDAVETYCNKIIEMERYSIKGMKF